MQRTSFARRGIRQRVTLADLVADQARKVRCTCYEKSALHLEEGLPMPQKRPEYFPGGIYHLYNRGAHRVTIFREPANYLFVLRNLKKYLRELNLSLLAYCLMPNHYHFLVRQNGTARAGLLTQRVFNSYSKAYNKRYQHSGTLF